MDSKKITIISTVILAIALIAVFSFSQAGTGFFSLQPEKEETIKIGAILPLSGKYGYIGGYMAEGLEMAKDEINSSGSVNGRKLEIVYEDSLADTKTGISAYQKLARIDGVNVVFTTISGVSLGIAPLAEEDKKMK